MDGHPQLSEEVEAVDDLSRHPGAEAEHQEADFLVAKTLTLSRINTAEMVLNAADAEEETTEEAVAVALATRVVAVEVEEAALVVVVAADELDLINVLALFPRTAR